VLIAVVVQIEDQYDNVVTSDNAAITLGRGQSSREICLLRSAKPKPIDP
jgi:hypothetical protein